MAKYSNIEDVKDELVKKFSKEADHLEGEEYVDKVLSKLLISAEEVKDASVLKELSITFATYKRAFYEAKCKEDIFFKKYLNSEKELKELTSKLIKEHV
jgi:hypothetical protein